MTERVHVRYTKQDGSLHWHFDADVIARDHHGTWVVVPPGGWYRKGGDPPQIDDSGFVVLVPNEQWWTAYFNPVPKGSNHHLVYVDVNSEPIWEGAIVSMVDLDLDVVVAPGGTARVIDEDELEEHRVRWSYPPHLVDRVRTTAARIAGDIDLGREPFASAGPDHVARVLGWSRGAIGAIDPTDGTAEVTIAHRLAPDAPSSLRARLATAAAIHDAVLVRHEDGGLTVRTTPAAELRSGEHVSVWVDPAQAMFDVA
jgi:hypothetical protein